MHFSDTGHCACGTVFRGEYAGLPMPNDVGALNGECADVLALIWRGRTLRDLNPVHGYSLCVRIDREFYRIK